MRRPRVGNRSTLTDGDVRVIRWRVKKGDNRLEIAQEYGVSKQTIDKIHWGHTFAHVQDNPEDELESLELNDPIMQNAADESAEKLMEIMKKRGLM